MIKPDGSVAGWNVYYKIWLSDRLQDGQLPGNILEKFESRHSSAELKVLDIPFDFPKPTALIKFLMSICDVKEGEITMDFFSGSGTTGHAAIEFSCENGGTRPFICIQLSEKTEESSDEYKKGFQTISEIGKERIRRAGQKIKQVGEALASTGAEKEELVEAKASPTPTIDIGFRVLKIDSSNMKDVYYTPDAVQQGDLADQVDNIREGRTAEDLLFQVLLDWGVDLTLPITQEIIAGLTVLFVDGNALAACFDTDINEPFVKELAARHPLRVVFRDAGFANDSVKINIEQIFKLVSPQTEIKSL